MVGCKTVDAVHVGPQGLYIFFPGQARPHLAAAGMPMTDGGNVVPGQEQMVRAHLAGNLDAAFFGSLD